MLLPVYTVSMDTVSMDLWYTVARVNKFYLLTYLSSRLGHLDVVEMSSEEPTTRRPGPGES